MQLTVWKRLRKDFTLVTGHTNITIRYLCILLLVWSVKCVTSVRKGKKEMSKRRGLPKIPKTLITEKADDIIKRKFKAKHTKMLWKKENGNTSRPNR